MAITIVHTNILKNAGVDAESMPGFKEAIELALANDVESIPSLPAVPSSNTQRVTITDNCVLKAGKSSFTIEAEVDYNSMKVTPVGAQGSRLYKYEIGFRLVGTNVDIEAFGRMVKNAKYYGNIEDLNGVKRFLGMDGLPFSIVLDDGSGGQGPVDENGVYDSYKIVSYGVTPKPPRWTGVFSEAGSGSGS